MKRNITFGTVLVLLTSLLAACGGNTTTSSRNKKSSSSPTSTITSQGPRKSIEVSSISLRNQGDKAYITVSGTQTNYTADDFTWAWGLKAKNGSFADGKENPAAEDFKKETFNASNSFTLDYCLTDIENLESGTLYTIYAGTPESYQEIKFASNQFGASDATRKYYLRQDEENALVFEYIQPVTYSQASIVEITSENLPEGVTKTGAYLKFGGTNSKNLTMETINGWHTANKIAGDFQRVIPENSYSQQVHSDDGRFWTIEGNYVYFYLYVGFIESGEGWMLHFDLVGGSTNTGAQTDTKINGVSYTVDGKTYKVYSDRNASGETNYWGCIGVYRES